MSSVEPVPGWWQASDGQWYPPQASTTPRPPQSPPGVIGAVSPMSVIVNTGPVVQTAAAPGAASTLANLVWLIVGIPMAFGYLFAGLLNCIFVVTIPFGIQAFKLAGYALWPFGRVVVQRPGRDVGLSTLGNVIWFITSGIWLALGHLIFGLFACITVIGIPFGLASFKMAGLALVPFGQMVVPRHQVPVGSVVVSSL